MTASLHAQSRRGVEHHIGRVCPGATCRYLLINATTYGSRARRMKMSTHG